MDREAARRLIGRDRRVRRFAEEHLQRLQSSWEPDLVLVFGSRARGDALEDSDLDLIVVSPRFEGIPFLDRIHRVLDDLQVPFGVDLLCYTPAEFAEKRDELGTVGAAVAEGVPL